MYQVQVVRAALGALIHGIMCKTGINIIARIMTIMVIIFIPGLPINSSFDPYLVMKNVNKMEDEAIARGADPENPYDAVGRFVKAYYFYNLTSMFGDVPLTDALQAPAISSPDYTPQEQVFKYVLNQLDSANTEFSTLMGKNDNSLSASQDIFYGGNLTAWQKLVNSFKLRVLVSLSNKASDAALKCSGSIRCHT